MDGCLGGAVTGCFVMDGSVTGAVTGESVTRGSVTGGPFPDPAIRPGQGLCIPVFTDLFQLALVLHCICFEIPVSIHSPCTHVWVMG